MSFELGAGLDLRHVNGGQRGKRCVLGRSRSSVIVAEIELLESKQERIVVQYRLQELVVVEEGFCAVKLDAAELGVGFDLLTDIVDHTDALVEIELKRFSDGLEVEPVCLFDVLECLQGLREDGRAEQALRVLLLFFIVGPVVPGLIWLV